MLDPVFCERLVVEPRPRLGLEALRELRRLVEAHSVSLVEKVGSTDDSSSPSGERHEPIPSHDGGPASTAPAIPRDDGRVELWNSLTERQQQECRQALHQMLVAVVLHSRNASDDRRGLTRPRTGGIHK